MWSPVLVGLVCLSSVAATTTAAHASTGATSTAQTTLSSSQFETRLVNRINHRRVNHGCRAFRSNAALELAGDRHTQLMVADREVSHQLSGEAALGTRVTRAGYTHWRIVAENLAWGQATPRAVFRAWVHSAGHRANLDNCRLRDIGIAVVVRSGRPWVTADFGRRRT
jgi:uncharacterized protein YkwD